MRAARRRAARRCAVRVVMRGDAWWCVVRGGARWCVVVRGGAWWCVVVVGRDHNLVMVNEAIVDARRPRKLRHQVIGQRALTSVKAAALRKLVSGWHKTLKGAIAECVVRFVASGKVAPHSGVLVAQAGAAGKGFGGGGGWPRRRLTLAVQRQRAWCWSGRRRLKTTPGLRAVRPGTPSTRAAGRH